MAKTNFDFEEKIWYGDKVPFNYNVDCNAGVVMIESLKKYPNKVVQISVNNGFEITGKEMASLSIRVAQNLQLKGLQQEDVIGIMASNTQYLAPVVYGAFLCGTPISTLDPSFQKLEIKHMYKITKPKLIFCDAECYQNVKESVIDLNLNCTIFIMKGQVAGVGNVEKFLKSVGDEDSFIPPKLVKGGDHIAAIMSSSGTTGLPKGVCISHSILLNTSETVSDQDILLHFSTMYWLSGLIMLTLSTLSGATHIILDEPFSVQKCFDIIAKYKVSVMLTSPSLLAFLIQSSDIKSRNLNSLKFYFLGGSALYPPFYKEMQKYLNNGYIIFSYGMSEICGGGAAGILPLEKLTSSGQVINNTEIKICGEDGKSLGVGQTGEIHIRKPFKWPGYYSDPDATRQILDEEGWVHSGDLGYFDNDGYLYVVDRIKDLLKYKNYQYYPTEIESVILDIPGVIEVAVCGLPDVLSGDLPAAAIVKRPDSALTEQEIYDYVAKKMSDIKKLRGGVYFIDSLPKTPSAKVQRNKVREILLQIYETKTLNKL